MRFFSRNKKEDDTPEVKTVKQSGRNRKLYPVTVSDFDTGTVFNVDPTLDSKNKRYGLTDDGVPFSENKNRFALRKDTKKYTKLTGRNNRVAVRDKNGEVKQIPLNEISDRNRFADDKVKPKSHKPTTSDGSKRRRGFFRK